MKGSEIRDTFLKFFESKGHTIVPSSSLVPHNDPTLLFSNAGMNQFKNCFLGTEKRPYVRATTCQKVMRISGKHNDLENIGVTARHHTFFEMLGNFSFGDYFKRDAILFAWEFITQVLKLPKDKLWVTIYEEDDDAGKLWAELTDVDPARILKLGAEDNFWAMGDTGPCGPCSEIHYYIGDDPASQCEANFRKDDGTYLEFWNLVFMQFNRSADGTLTPLPKPSVDTGMGFERMASIIQGVKSNYDTDLLRDIIRKCEELSGFKYDGSSYAVRDLRSDKPYARDVAMRVIADHCRSITMLTGDGVNPGSDGRGYVLRRVLRRAVRHGQVLEFKEPFLAKVCERVIEVMGGHYAELRERKDHILKVVDAEERKFHETLESGLHILKKEAEEVKKGEQFSGATAFLLHDTYGFPVDLTDDALKPYGISVDHAAFEKEMDAQRTRSREDRKSKGITFVAAAKIDGPKTKFLGYTELKATSPLLYSAVNDDQVQLVFAETPFYAESGGQVGDTGTIDFGDVTLEVIDTQKIQDGYFVHSCEVIKGTFSEKLNGKSATLTVDQERRDRIRAHHSATHIVHAALKEQFGDHIKQAGSRVSDTSLRFDYSHFEQVSSEQLEKIQDAVNSYIQKNYEVSTKILKIEEAKKTGATALFGEKYGDTVRVVEIGPKSLEFCGGTHVTRSGDIGFLTITSEGGISSGVRRIECFAGGAATRELVRMQQELHALSSFLKTDQAGIVGKVEKLVAQIKNLEKETEHLKSKVAQASSGDLASSARTSPKGVKVIVEKVADTDTDTLKGMVDRLRIKLGSGVVALATTQGDQAVLIAGVTSDLSASVHAGNLVKEAAKLAGGKGGGRADFAQAGGLSIDKVQASLDKVFELVG